MRVRKSATALCGVNMGKTWGHLQRQVRVTRPLTTQAVSLPNLYRVSCVLRRNGGFVRVAIEAWIEATPLRIDRGALRY
jgi:hypothetical protein